MNSELLGLFHQFCGGQMPILAWAQWVILEDDGSSELLPVISQLNIGSMK